MLNIGIYGTENGLNLKKSWNRKVSHRLKMKNKPESPRILIMEGG